jgi:hypothetical protein
MNQKPASRAERRMFESLKGPIPEGETLYVATFFPGNGLRARAFILKKTLH